MTPSDHRSTAEEPNDAFRLRHLISFSGMAKGSAEDPRLAHLTKIALALPETARRCHAQHAAFLVRKRTFAYFLKDHHGDGIVSLCCKVFPGDNAALAAAQPARVYLPAYIGPRGWVALRLDRGKVNCNEVEELLTTSYQLIAPKRLTALIKVRA